MDKAFGYVRVVTAVPPVSVAEPAVNLRAILELAEQALRQRADVVVFPELALTGYTCADLFLHDTLLAAAERALAEFIEATRAHPAVYLLGLPVRVRSLVYNCACIAQRGRILGLIPKSFLANYGEFYERRWFAAGLGVVGGGTVLCGQGVPFGVDLLFQATGVAEFAIGVEICEDLWAPIPPSSRQALAGATVLANLSASDDLVGKADYRRQLVAQQSGRCLAAYAYCSAGVDESTTDMVCGGHQLVAENGAILGEAERFVQGGALQACDVDVAFLAHERARSSSFRDSVAEAAAAPAAPSFRRIAFDPAVRDARRGGLCRPLKARPFVPSDAARRHEVCAEIFAIQSTGLVTRLKHTGMRDPVIGLSGGLDSTLALLVAVEACNRLKLEHRHIHAITMPGFGTSARTLGNVRKLCRRLGVQLQTIPIHASCEQHLRDLGHDGHTHDTAYENAQARERTQILMDRANMVNGLVVGTGDLSELALGWSTYNGDHMSMYAVNCGVPKTLVAYLIEYVADTWHQPKVGEVLRDILATPISPELLPPDANGEIVHKTEDILGPYEVHDFFLYHMVRCGFPPEKTLFLAEQAFKGVYTRSRLRACLRTFVTRFFRNQFKRSCLPDGPKVGTVALSPRGDWRMPSDAAPGAWLERV